MRRLTFQCVYCNADPYRRREDFRDHQMACPKAIAARRERENEYNRIRSQRASMLFTINQGSSAEPR
jgi:hypothetical protein